MNALSLVFINGQLDKSLSNSAVDIQCEKNKMTLRIAKHHQPIHVTYLNGCENLERHIILEENSELSLIEEYTADHKNHYVTQSTLSLTLHKNAKMKYYKIQNENSNAAHHGAIDVNQQEASEIAMFFADCGSQKSLSDIKINLAGRHAACHMHGLYFLNHDAQEINNHIHVEHGAELGTSSMVFKGVLAKKSKAQFTGKVHVDEKAKRTHAHQENHNLLLSPHAEVGSKPQLEIYADDIKCTHGATVGQLNQDLVFYLRSRGIDEASALKMLTDAFVAEIMEKIEDASIRHYIQERVMQHEIV